ncbi:hypothetical protein [Candidatus Colwellia aromaticivorans]|uniref:hypothetical protein n=1 Tax=Candidatus Colwellia aromaticivorans TaxID=2267621 RepID=UPI00109B778F|nr:hypothetical protein [Candidatus Colwellia aromaticivorans]
MLVLTEHPSIHATYTDFKVWNAISDFWQIKFSTRSGDFAGYAISVLNYNAKVQNIDAINLSG